MFKKCAPNDTVGTNEEAVKVAAIYPLAIHHISEKGLVRAHFANRERSSVRVPLHFAQAQNVQLTRISLESSLKLEKASILGDLDTVAG